MDEELVTLGREVVANKQLQELRNVLGISRTSMADLLHTTRSIYNNWEEHPDVKLRPESALRVGRFYRHATAQLAALSADDINIAHMIPLFIASSRLGVGLEMLHKRYREGTFYAEDLGLLGLWVYQDELDTIAGAL